MWFYLLLLVVSLLLFRRWAWRRNLPPGPPTVPLLGCLPYTRGVRGVKLITSTDLYKYGPLVSIELIWGITIIVINDFKLAKELFAKDSFSGRPVNYSTTHVRGFNKKPRGIVDTQGQDWSEQRRFALKQLRDFGFGRQSLDVSILDEANALITSLLEETENKGKVQIEGTFNVPVVNVLWQMVASKRFDPKDREVQELMDGLTEIFKPPRPGFRWIKVIFFLPFLRPVLPYPEVDVITFDIKDMIRKQVLEHEQEHDPNAPPRDFIDVYLTEVKSENGSSSVSISDEQREHLVTTCLDFFQAGAETSSTTLAWSVLFMAVFPDVQARCQKEIDSVLGSAPPSKDDASRLLYVSATLNEVQRVAVTAPGSLPHEVTSDQTVNGYTIPTGAMVICNLRKFLRDPQVFADPESFNPDRFLDASTGGLVKYDQFVPFGIGKRICMGETLARHEMFLFFVAMLQQCNISLPKDGDRPDPNDPIIGMTTMPKPFNVCFTRRS